MRSFFRLRAQKAARGRAEIRGFWENRGVVFACESPRLSLEASTSSSDTPEDLVVAREYAELTAANASEEELLAWATRQEKWDFVP